jgi:hypothetical protein
MPGPDREQFEAAMRVVFGPVYRGVPVPEQYRIDWGKELTAALAWRKGVDAAKDYMPDDPQTVPVVGESSWRFLIDWGEEDIPQMTTLDGLESRLRALIEQNHYSGDSGYPTLYRYLGRGAVEPLIWSHVPGTGTEWVRDDENDTDENAPAHQYPLYRVLGVDGTCYLKFAVGLT